MYHPYFVVFLWYCIFYRIRYNVIKWIKSTLQYTVKIRKLFEYLAVSAQVYYVINLIYGIKIYKKSIKMLSDCITFWLHYSHALLFICLLRYVGNSLYTKPKMWYILVFNNKNLTNMSSTTHANFILFELNKVNPSEHFCITSIVRKIFSAYFFCVVRKIWPPED